MKKSLRFDLVLCATVGLLHSVFSQVPEQINYQGRLVQGTNLVSGSQSMVFKLYNVESGGAPLYVETQTVSVVDGVYATAIGASNGIPGSLSAVLTNPNVYLELTVGGDTLSPRERLHSVAYALVAAGVPDGAIARNMLEDDVVGGDQLAAFAVAAQHLSVNSVSGSNVQDGSLTGGDISDGSLTAVDVAANTFWKTDGNTGTTIGAHFLGTSDQKPLELRANGVRVAYFSYFSGDPSPNVVFWGAENGVGGLVSGSVVGGGSENEAYSSYATISGGYSNRLAQQAHYAVISGGNENLIADHAYHAVVSGGRNNQIKDGAHHAVISGGEKNEIGTNSSYSVVNGGRNNQVMFYSPYVSIGGGVDNMSGSNTTYSTIGGGSYNTIADDSRVATISGGYFNSIGTNADYAVIGGGRDHEVGKNSQSSAIGGGFGNVIGEDSPYATILGGQDNEVGDHATYAIAAGYRAKANHPGSFVWADAANADFQSSTNNEFAISAVAGVRIQENAGAGKRIELGRRFRDNAIIAWGRVRHDGVLEDDFGVASVVKAGTGQYDIIIDATPGFSTAIIPLVSPELDVQPTTAASVRIACYNVTGVKAFTVYMNQGTFAPVDNDFTFIVTGR